jgi:hypothetical protein
MCKLPATSREHPRQRPAGAESSLYPEPCEGRFDSNCLHQKRNGLRKQSVFAFGEIVWMRNNVQVARKLPLGTLLGQPAAHAIGVGMVQIPTQTVSTITKTDLLKETSHKDDKSTSIEVLLFILLKKSHTSPSLPTEETAELL